MIEWNKNQLGELIEVKYGKDHKKLLEGKIPCYGSGGIMRLVDNSLYDKESILIPRKGSLNNLFYVNEPFWTVDTLFWTKINIEKVEPKFLFYNLKLIDFEGLNVGSAVPSLTTPVINEIEVNLPPLSEQKAIASVLSSLDDKIDLLHRQNETLEKMAETLFRKWFEFKKYDDFLSKIIDTQNGYAFKSKDFNLNGENRIIKIKNISNKIVDVNSTDFVNANIVKTLSSKFKLKSGDVIIAMTGAEIGKIGLIPNSTENLWLNQRVGLFVEKISGARFLAYLCLNSELGQDYITNTATGSAQPNISSQGIIDCPFPNLTDDEVNYYTSILNPLFDKIIFNLNEIKTLNSLRNVLLPKLMSGEIRVKLD